MTGHKVVYANSSDCNLLHTFDMTTGRYQGVEFNHMEALDDVYRDPSDGGLVLEFDDDGGAVMKSLGDGQTSVMVAPRVNSGAYFRTFNGGELVIKISPDTQIRYQADKYGSPTSDPVRIENISDGSLLMDPAMSGSIDVTIGGVAYTNSFWLNSSWSQARRMSLYIPSNLFYQEHMWFVVQAGSPWSGAPYSTYLVKAHIDPTTGVGTMVQHWAIGGENWCNGIDNYVGNNIFVMPNGHFALEGWGNKWVEFDIATETATQHDGFGQFQPVTLINDALHDNKNSTVIMPSFDLNNLMTTGLASTVLNADMSVQETVVPAQTALFPFPVTEYDYDSGFDDGGMNRIVVFIDNVKNDTTGDWLSPRKMLLLDFETGECLAQDFKIDLENTITCKFSEMQLRDVICKDNVPVYRVKGVIANDGNNRGTELFLMDNTSMMICGRTTSDPISGAYKFRCYNPGKKSVFAKHPTSGGLRMAAEVTPVLDN